MKKSNLLKFLLLLLFTTSLFSQKKQGKYTQPNKNAIYFEVSGLSLKSFSINYDRLLFTSKNIYFNSTVGFGFGNHKKIEANGYSIPVYLNLTTGLLKKNHFEIGVGITYNNTEYIHDKEEIIYSGLKLSYKYQSKSPFFIKGGINLFDRFIVLKDDKNSAFEDLKLIGNIFSLSAGYSF